MKKKIHSSHLFIRNSSTKVSPTKNSKLHFWKKIESMAILIIHFGFTEVAKQGIDGIFSINTHLKVSKTY